MLQKIIKILKEELFIESEITKDSNLKNDLGIDSVASIELSLQMENEFGIKISEEELLNLVTVNDILILLESKGITM